MMNPICSSAVTLTSDLVTYLENNPQNDMRILVFGDIWEFNKERANLSDLWVSLHRRLNPDCDFLIVDSKSPYTPTFKQRHPNFPVLEFPNDIGHSFRNGLDGWGRAFCAGLDWAVVGQYDFVVHIEGDSLCRMPVRRVCQWMRSEHIKAVAAATSINKHWPETGLMMFDVCWVERSGFVASYDWAGRKTGHQPEPWVRDLLGNKLMLLPWRMMRDDHNKLTPDNVNDYVWISHTKPEMYRLFAEGKCAEFRRPLAGITWVRLRSLLDRLCGCNDRRCRR